MYSVYAIKSLNRNYIYVGLTSNLSRRISDHNNGFNRTTKPYIPFEVIHTEQFNSIIKARLREKYLKSGIGKEYLRSIVK